MKVKKGIYQYCNVTQCIVFSIMSIMQTSWSQPESWSDDLKGEREGSVEDTLLASACHKPADSIRSAFMSPLDLFSAPSLDLDLSTWMQHRTRTQA